MTEHHSHHASAFSGPPAGGLPLLLLSALLLASAVALVYTQHARRSLFGELRDLERTRDELQIEWGQLQIEQSTLAAPERVEQLAAEKLRLYSPTAQQVELLHRTGWTDEAYGSHAAMQPHNTSTNGGGSDHELMGLLGLQSTPDLFGLQPKAGVGADAPADRD